MKEVQEPSRHFKSYYQDNSLLIQLMTVEFAAIYERVSQIELLDKMHLPNNQEEYLHHLQQHLTFLIGEVAARHCFSSSSGPLTNLKDYCELFCQNAVQQHRAHLSLSTQIYQAWLDVIHNLHLIQNLNACTNHRKAKLIFNQIRKAIQSLIKKTESSLKHFINSLKTFKSNENIIFFLFRKKESLIKKFGLKQFNAIFSLFEKNQNITQLLIKRFKLRGFDHLLPAIKQELFLYESYKHLNA